MPRKTWLTDLSNFCTQSCGYTWLLTSSNICWQKMGTGQTLLLLLTFRDMKKEQGVAFASGLFILPQVYCNIQVPTSLIFVHFLPLLLSLIIFSHLLKYKGFVCFYKLSHSFKILIPEHQRFEKKCYIFRSGHTASIFGHLSSLSKPLSFVYRLKSCCVSHAPAAKQKSLSGNTLSVVKRDNLQIHILKLQFWFLQSLGNSKNKHHSTTLHILETAFKSQNAPNGIQLCSQDLCAAEFEELSEIFSKRVLLNSQNANLSLHLC